MAETMRMMKISEIHPYRKNPRKNDQSVQYVANSIKEFGFRAPIIVDKDMTIIAGHTRYKAALKLRLKTVPVIVADDLTPAQADAYRIADNSSGQGSEWDDALLGDILGDLPYDMEDFGLEVPSPEGEDGGPDIETVEAVPFRKAYVLIVSDLDSYDQVAAALDGLAGVPGVEMSYVTKED